MLMLKLRLKKTGRKGLPCYRLVIIEDSRKRNGRTIDEIGWYNPSTKKLHFNRIKTEVWLAYGVVPTKSAWLLLKRAKIID